MSFRDLSAIYAQPCLLLRQQKKVLHLSGTGNYTNMNAEYYGNVDVYRKVDRVSTNLILVFKIYIYTQTQQELVSTNIIKYNLIS